MEIPEQYQKIRQLGLLNMNQIKSHKGPKQIPVLPPPGFALSASIAIGSAPYFPVTIPANETGQGGQNLNHEQNNSLNYICPICTYINVPTATNCEICDTPRLPPSEAATSASQEQETPSIAQTESMHDKLLLSYRELQEAQLCGICEELKKDMVFQCGHETCSQCSSKLSNCPICRVRIVSRIRRFIS